MAQKLPPSYNQPTWWDGGCHVATDTPTRPPHDVANHGDSQTQRHVPNERPAVLQFSHQARMLPTHHINSVIMPCARLVFVTVNYRRIHLCGTLLIISYVYRLWRNIVCGVVCGVDCGLWGGLWRGLGWFAEFLWSGLADIATAATTATNNR